MSWAEKIRLNPSSASHNSSSDAKKSVTSDQQQATRRQRRSSLHAAASPLLLLSVFHFLSARELALKCSQVCHAWRNVIHEPVAWDFAWKQYQIDVETGFGRDCFDPLPQLLRLAGFSSSPSPQTQPNIVMPPTTNNLLLLSSPSSTSWQTLQARGGPGLLSDSEIEYILAVSAKRHCDDRYKAIVRSGSYRLRYILSLLAHSHELRRDFGYEDSFGGLTIAKNYLRRRFLRSFLSQKRKEQKKVEQENQRRRELLEGRENTNDENENNAENEHSTMETPASSSSHTTSPALPPTIPPVSDTAVFCRNRTKRVRCLTFVDKLQWQDWLGATQDEVGDEVDTNYENQDDDYDEDYHYGEDEEGYDDYYPEEEGVSDKEHLYDDEGNKKKSNPNSNNNNLNPLRDESASSTTSSSKQNESRKRIRDDSKSMLSHRAHSKDTVGSLTALETLQTLRSCPSQSVTKLNAMQALNIFSHLHAGAELPSTCAVSIVDATDCVNAEDDEILTDVAALVLGEQPYHLEDNNNNNGSDNKTKSSSRKLRLVEVTLRLADDIIKTAATRPKEKESASKILADFALRPLSRYMPPCALDQVDITMRAVGVGRSNMANAIAKSPVAPKNERMIKKLSFLNADSSSSSSPRENKGADAVNADDDDYFGDDGEDFLMPSTMMTSELSLSECLSLLCAPKFFSGPELCQEHSISILAVDPLRLCLIKLRA